MMTGTANSYQCTCRKGFSLSEDQHNCTGEVVYSNLYISAWTEDEAYQVYVDHILAMYL